MLQSFLCTIKYVSTSPAWSYRYSQLKDKSHRSNSNDSPVVLQVHQSGTNINDPLAVKVHQGDINDGHQTDNNSVGPSDFDSECYTADDEYISQPLASTHIEKHFRSMLDKTRSV